MSKSNVFEIRDQREVRDPLSDLLQTGAQRMISQAIELEVTSLLESYKEWRMPDGRAGVVRNGYQPERSIQTGIGPVTVQVPKVRSKTGIPVTFRSALIPPYIRRT